MKVIKMRSLRNVRPGAEKLSEVDDRLWGRKDYEKDMETNPENLGLNH